MSCLFPMTVCQAHVSESRRKEYVFKGAFVHVISNNTSVSQVLKLKKYTRYLCWWRLVYLPSCSSINPTCQRKQGICFLFLQGMISMCSSNETHSETKTKSFTSVSFPPNYVLFYNLAPPLFLPSFPWIKQYDTHAKWEATSCLKSSKLIRSSH